MLSYTKDGVVWECDECGADEEPRDISGPNGFADAWSRLKREGWTAAKIGTEWIHVCPKCAGEKSATKMFEK